MRRSSSSPLIWSGIICLTLVTAPLQAEGDLQTRKRAAGLPTTSQAQRALLADDPAWEVREVLGQNRRSSPALLTQLAQDVDSRVRIAVATNLSTPESVHMQLANDPDPQVRSVVARFEYVPIPVLLHLLDDPLVDIRLEVARSLNANERVLRKAMRDADPSVRDTAEQVLRTLRED